jgi:lipopolysaccharide biosynthesis regulator YciM
MAINTTVPRLRHPGAEALAASPRSATVHFAKGEILDAQQRFEEAIPEYETVIAFNRNWGGRNILSRAL